MSNREQSNKFLFILIVGGLVICGAWVGVGWIYDLVMSHV